MNADRLLAHYERIADVSDAVPRLRRFVLDLAVRGKLVDQNPNDEPAAALLKLIAKEKARLVKAGESRREKSLPEIESDDVPYEIPYGWAWTRIREITSNRGQTVPDCDLTYIDVTAINKKVGCIEGAKVISASEAPSRARKIVHKGDVLYSCVRPYLLNVAIVEREISPVPIASTAFAVLNGFELVLPRYQWIVLRSPGMVTSVEEKMRGQAYPAINGSDFALLLFPLPPLAEQHRIVAKFDELMALCDRLEVARTAREATRDRLSASSLVRLDVPDPDPVVFRNHAAFALENLTPLTTRRDQIKALHQTILNLAVRGKLVAQNPNDEPAAELLKRIAKEKARLVKTGELRQQKSPKPGDVNMLPFELEAGWQAVTIEQVLVELQTGPFGSSLHQSDYQVGGVPVVNPASIQNEYIVPIEKMAVGVATLDRLSTFKLRAGDIVMGRRGEMGRCAVVTDREAGWLCGTGSLVFRLPQCVYARFLVLLIGSPYVREYLGGSAVGATMQNLNQAILLSLVIGLPPLAEQHRIVAKVDELIALCDRLEASLATGDDTRFRLLGALLTEALEPGESHASAQAERVVAHG